MARARPRRVPGGSGSPEQAALARALEIGEVSVVRPPKDQVAIGGIEGDHEKLRGRLRHPESPSGARGALFPHLSAEDRGPLQRRDPVGSAQPQPEQRERRQLQESPQRSIG